MTVLQAAQSASIRLVGKRITSLFSSSEQIAVELADLATEVARDMAKAHDWRSLTVKAEMVGDSVSESFYLPSDYDRMPIKGNLYSTRSDLPLTPATDLDQWIEFELTPVVASPGYWIIIREQINIRPALATNDAARFYYVSRNFVPIETELTADNDIISTDVVYLYADQTSQAGIEGRDYFEADTDTFLLSERLLTLGLIWKWKAMKGLEYAEDLKNYEIAFQQEAGREKGSRMLAIGKGRISDGVELAYPGTIVVS